MNDHHYASKLPNPQQVAGLDGALDNRICHAVGCGNVLVRGRWLNGRLEPRRRWIDRQYCGRDCAAAHQSARMTARSAITNIGPDWPEITGIPLSGQCYAAHTLPLRAGATIKLDRPATIVETATVLGGR